MLVSDYMRAKKQFGIENSIIVDNIIERILTAETVLEGFSSHLESELTINFTHLSGVASNLIDRYPYLYMFEVAQRVNNENKSAFEKRLNEDYPGFYIRKFDYDNTRQWVKSESKEFYYPIIFQEPYYLDNRNIIGLDLTSNKALAKAMDTSKEKGIATATEPFQLAENKLGYVIHRAVSKETTFTNNPFEKSFYTLLVVSSDKMFDFEELTHSRIRLSVFYSKPEHDSSDLIVYKQDTKSETKQFSISLPILEFSKSISNITPSQPFIIKTQLPLSIQDVSLYLISFILLLSVIIPITCRTFLENFLIQKLAYVDDIEKLYQLANFDELTGLPNRARLNDHIEKLLAKSKRSKNSFTVFFIDIDKFKQINDKYGHAFGDYVLSEFALRLSSHLRENELLARLGGDEFVLVTDDNLTEKTVVTIKERLQTTFESPIVSGTSSLMLEFSIGEAVFPNDGKDILALLGKADSNMYKHKNSKKQKTHLKAAK